MNDNHDILGPSGSPEAGELVKALAAAQAEMKVVGYDSQNPHFKSRFSSLSQCVADLKGPLTKHGLSIPDFRPGLLENGDWVCVGTLRHGPSGQWISGICPLLMQKRDMQQFGAAMTYAKRTLLMALTGAASGEPDDDGNSVSQQQAAEKPAEDRAEKPRPADRAVKSMSYEALAVKAIEGADDAESARRALDTVELRAREGAVDRAVFVRCKERFNKKWTEEVKA